MSLLNRRDALRALLREREQLIVVAGLGSAAYDLAACGDEPLDFPLWGAMGGAAMVGLGLALAQPERTVVVVTGDGEMLMGLGSLATIAAQRPANRKRSRRKPPRRPPSRRGRRRARRSLRRPPSLRPPPPPPNRQESP